MNFDTELSLFLQRRYQAPAQVCTLAASLAAALREGHTWLPADLPLGGAVGTPGERTPLVQDDGRVFFQRQWQAEHRLAHALAQRSVYRPEQIAPETQALGDSLFPPAPADAQKTGAFLPFGFELAVITGGPGTGKTWVLGRLLALQAAQTRARGGALPRVALCAPTGKAAQRMAEALRQGARDLPAEFAEFLAALVPSTIHRLLGLGGPLSKARFDAQSPLPYDLVVVDEASMVDLHLMAALVDAVAPDAKLVLLGDADQLPSVEAGRVLGDVVDALAPLQPSPVVRLTVSRRFVGGQPVGVVARALNGGDADAALEQLRRPAGPEASCRLEPLDLPPLIAGIRRQLEPLFRASTVAQALAALGRFLVLTVVNEGVFGQAGLNRALRADLPEGSPRPIMITQNDMRTGLSNGDLGVVFTQGGRESAWFPVLGAEPRSWPPALLPPHQDAFAITVHKSQGSEFDRVFVVLPPVSADSPLVLSRELLYTAVTRARSHCTIFGDEAAVGRAVATRNQRNSGLKEQLHRWKNPTDWAILES